MASPTGSGQQQTKYESETPSHGLRFAYKASRIFRARRPLRLSGRLGTLLSASLQAQSVGKSASCRIASTPASFVPEAVDVKPWSPKPSLLRRLIAPIRDEGEGSGHKWSQNRRRAAPSDLPRERQSQFASPARHSQAMVAKAFHPSVARRPYPGRGEGTEHKWSRNRRRAAPGDSWRERQSQFASPWRRSEVMVVKALRPSAARCPDPGRGE
jgi:hypothetical protein